MNKLFPRLYKKDIYDIDYRGLYNRGFRAILFDIDNTLTTHGTKADGSNVAFFKNLRDIGFKTCLISNNKEKNESSYKLENFQVRQKAIANAIEKNDKTIYEFTNKIKQVLSFMQYAEFVFISALTGQRMNKMFELIDMVRENQTLRVQTGVLNEIITEATVMQQPPSDKGKRLKIFYTTQVAVKPPTFVIFVNNKSLMHFSYQRYLENRIRESFGFRGTALRFIIRERSEES